MKGTTKFLPLLALSLLVGFSAKEVKAQAGGAAVPFLLITPDARASGMGDVGTGIADNVHALYWNVGGLAFLNERQVSLSYSRWLPQFNADLFYSQASYGQYVEEVGGVLAGSFTFMNLGEFTRTFTSGQQGGTFRSNDFALSVAYSTYLDDNDELGAGIQFRYIQSNLASGIGDGGGTGRSAGIDVGLLWKPLELNIAGVDLSDRFAVGFNLQNLGPSMTYNAQADPLPSMLRIGLSYYAVRDEFNEFLIAIDMGKLLVNRGVIENEDGTSTPFTDRIPKSLITAWENPGVELALGAEYWYQQVFALRAGYFSEPASLGNRVYLTFGVGAKVDALQIDVSFISPTEQNHPLANTLRFSLLADI